MLCYFKHSCTVRSTSNKVRHSADLLIEEGELDNHLDNLVEFLESLEHQNTKEELKKIDKLRKDVLPISKEDQLDVIDQNAKVNTTHPQRIDMLDEIKQALSRMQMSTQTSFQELNKRLADPDGKYEELKQNLKSDMIEFNNQNHSSIPVSPLIEENDTPIVDFYVWPVIGSTDAQKPTEITSLWDVFYSKTRTTRFREIYVTSVAGMGKTAFSKRLATSWCQAHSAENNQTETIVEDDQSVMKTFDYLFLIPLRETCKIHCTVNEMVLHQVVKHLSRGHDYSMKLLQDVLHNENCLVILDGLDEWTHTIPTRCCCHSSIDIPHRKSHKHCTILSTTRPWKLSTLNLKTSQIDNHLSITGLGVESTKQLIKNSFTKLKTRERDVTNQIDAFGEAIKFKSIDELKRVPLILTYLICLWVDDFPFGNSRCEIYSNLVGLLLAKAEERKHANLIRPTDSKRRKMEMPEAISKNDYCLKYYSFLTKLGHLAFETYIDNKNREFSLVFDRDVAKNRLGDNYLKFSLSSGLLTQHKIKGHYTTRRYRIAFAHKSFQEFLAALYMFTVNINSPMTKQIKRLCDSVPNILSISHFYIFLSGLCPDKVRALSNEIQKVIIASDITQSYRSDMGSWNYFVGYNETMKKLQNLHVTCTEECEDNSNELIEIQMDDFIIDSDFESRRYSNILQRIMISNKKNMKSIKVRNIQTVEKFKEVTNIFKGSGTQNLEKIDLKCVFGEKELDALLKDSYNSLKCFVIKGGQWKDDKWNHNRISLSNESYRIIQSLKCLEKLYLRNIEMSHTQLEGLVDFLCSRPEMKQIGLENIKCSSHDECEGVSFDLSNHSFLKFLEIGEIPFSSVQINTSALEVCYVGKFPKAMALSSVLLCLQKAKYLHRFYCGFLASEEDVSVLLKTIPTLVNTELIWLTRINIGDKHVLISPNMAKLEKIVMLDVTMEYSALRRLFMQTVEMNQPVKVGLFAVSVTPELKAEEVKNEIRNSKKVVMLLDGKDENGQDEFLFQTVPQVTGQHE
ncbi:uncharacterized protein LOC123556210 isoform X2 [Mercenaria mercenaria]|uniref:uncharacterized protein LOC123556210 isoform X2 n=1 Tax=Mercenaria mercenaria TaxID=6596 RepID=UPI00234E8C33|nr:uncharacterized protein LOC123556210 isoform X2 [Mercenaria mercenaria]